MWPIKWHVLLYNTHIVHIVCWQNQAAVSNSSQRGSLYCVGFSYSLVHTKTHWCKMKCLQSPLLLKALLFVTCRVSGDPGTRASSLSSSFHRWLAVTAVGIWAQLCWTLERPSSVLGPWHHLIHAAPTAKTHCEKSIYCRKHVQCLP